RPRNWRPAWSLGRRTLQPARRRCETGSRRNDRRVVGSTLDSPYTRDDLVNHSESARGRAFHECGHRDPLNIGPSRKFRPHFRPDGLIADDTDAVLANDRGSDKVQLKSSRNTLEAELESKLQFAGVGRRGLNSSERTRRQIGDRRTKIHAIEEVEHFETKLEGLAAEGDPLDEGQIRVDHPWAAH